MRRSGVLVGLSLILATASLAENLMTNGTFDVPAIDFSSEDPAVHWSGTGWTYWGNVFRERWAAHSGHAGGFFKGWWDGSGGNGIFQNIPCTGGLYTFTAWVRREPAFASLNNLEIKIEWMDANTNWTDTTVFGYYNTFPADALWHQIHVTATGTNPNIAFIRPVLYCNWNSAGGALSFDDMELYPGPYTGAPPRLLNRSFEFSTTNGMRGTQWALYPDWYEDWGPGNDPPWEVVWWAARSSELGLVFQGWKTYSNSYSLKLYQNIHPGTGTFTFAIWLNREAGFLMTNAGLRVDWYDGTFTNVVSDGVQTNFIVPGDTNWHEYFVTGTCTSPAAEEARVQLFVDWEKNLGGDNKALRIDDARFFAGPYVPSPGPELGALLSHVYFNNPNAGSPEAESVPGLGGTKFFEYSYDPDVPSYYHVLTPQTGIAQVRARTYFQGADVELWSDGARYTSVVIDSSAPFHGYPAAGAVTMDVWRVAFHAPGNWQNNMWYSPAVRLAADGVEWWCAKDVDGVTSGDVWTNDWPINPQRFLTRIPYDHDFYYWPTGTIPRYVTTDWAYYNNTNYNPRTEVIPAMDGTSTFMQVDYASTATVWYILAEKPIRQLLPGEYSQVMMRTAWQDPTDGHWNDSWQLMSWVSNLVLEAPGTTFHGLPAAGKHTVDLWRIVWAQPLNTNVVPAVPYTNAITVYYAPMLKVGFGNHVVDERYLLARIDGLTNRWGFNNYPTNPQFYGPIYWDNHDYSYINQWSVSGETDGIPNWWWQKYFPGDPGQWVAGNDADDDGFTNGEEFAGDSDPTDDTSFFTGVRDMGLGMVGTGWSTNSRTYFVQFKTNLLDGVGWQDYGVELPGRADGGGLDLSVTNDAPQRFYRIGVKVPP